MVKKLPLTRSVSPAVMPVIVDRAELALVSGGLAESATAQQRSEMSMAVIGNLR